MMAMPLPLCGLRRRHMLKKLWSTLLTPSDPPWVTPRLVAGNTLEYDQLRARLDSVDTPLEERARTGAIEVLRDPGTGQGWDLIVVEDGPSPLYGLRPRASH